MSKNWKKVFENQPPVPCSFVSNMDDSGYDENAVLFFEETGALGEAYRLYKIKDFKDGRNTLVIPSEVNGKPVVEIGDLGKEWLFNKTRLLYVPNSVKQIDFGIFDNKHLENVVLGNVEIVRKALI